MRRLLSSLIGVCLLTAVVAAQVGTIVVTKVKMSPTVTQVNLAWTSSAGGAVSGNSQIIRGYLIAVKFVPGSGGAQPTDLYDAVMLDANGIDILVNVSASGANLSNATATRFNVNRVFLEGTADLQITNAGASKSGTVVLLIAAQ